MRDEKEERKKQARSNKQTGKATQHTQGSHMYMHVDYMHVDYMYTILVAITGSRSEISVPILWAHNQ